MSARAVVVARAEPTPSAILRRMANDMKSQPDGSRVMNLQYRQQNDGASRPFVVHMHALCT